MKDPNDRNTLHNRGTIALLKKLGLSPNAVKCYLASLGCGSLPISQLAQHAGIHRVNAYAAVKELVENGLVQQDQIKGRKLITPAALTRLEDLAQDAQRSMTRLRWNVADLIPQLAKACAAGTATGVDEMGEVLFYRGDDAFYKVAERTLQASPQSKIDIINFIDYFHQRDHPAYDEEYYIPRRVARNITARVLYRFGEQEGERLMARDAQELRETRFLQKDQAFPCSIYIYENEVAFLWTATQTFGLVVLGGPIVEVTQMFFDMLWSSVKKSSNHKF